MKTLYINKPGHQSKKEQEDEDYVDEQDSVKVGGGVAGANEETGREPEVLEQDNLDLLDELLGNSEDGAAAIA